MSDDISAENNNSSIEPNNGAIPTLAQGDQG